MSLDESLIYYSDIYSQNINSYNDYIFRSSVLKNIYWEENLTNEICKYIENDSDFLDIGSNIGLISLSVKKKLKDNKSNKKIKNIHCFECNNDTFKCLKYGPLCSKIVQFICPFFSLNGLILHTNFFSGNINIIGVFFISNSFCFVNFLFFFLLLLLLVHLLIFV